VQLEVNGMAKQSVRKELARQFKQQEKARRRAERERRS
jgi:hypothetical protein